MKKRILIVGQTPPPYGGQAVMIAHLLSVKYDNVELYHVRMAFSRGMKDLGKFQLYKLFHLIAIIIQIYYFRIFKGTKILYYPPSGPNSAVYRDIAILFPTRWMFSKTIFHFHASGLSQHLRTHNKLFKTLFKVCFFYPDIAIRLSTSCPNEGLFIHAKKDVIIPNGMPDEAIFPNEVKSQNCINLLFIGLLEETKGELDLLRSVSILKSKGIKSIVRIAGEFKSQEYKKHFFDVVEEYNLSNDVEYLGIIRGDKKNAALRNSDIFCFPSYFHSESFPLVLIEAMSFGLPIVTTKWRGIVDMVQEGYNGFLVDIKSPELLASQIELLYQNINLRKKISINSRKEFEQKYSLQRHLEQMNELFNTI